MQVKTVRNRQTVKKQIPERVKSLIKMKIQSSRNVMMRTSLIQLMGITSLYLSQPMDTEPIGHAFRHLSGTEMGHGISCLMYRDLLGRMALLIRKKRGI